MINNINGAPKVVTVMKDVVKGVVVKILRGNSYNLHYWS
jgi:hypothetical protein